MGRVFMSTLGTSKYVPCHYCIGDRRSELVVFVQEALVHRLASNWSRKDRIVIFCTEEAKKNNWDDGGHYPEGLESRLRGKGLPPRIAMISIPTGKTEGEIMEIFLKVMEVFEEGDEVFLDITHSFRSIPLLMTVVMNYGKILKDISVGGIFYGALEALGTPTDVARMPEDARNIPVFDLTPYDALLEWARAVEMFKKAGYAGALSQLLNKNLGRLFRKNHHPREILTAFSSLRNSLDNLSKNLATARGPEIHDLVLSSSSLIEKVEDTDLIPPMKPLFEMLRESLRGFEIPDPMERTLHAAKWCVDHLMIPQAYALLREGIITGLCRCAGHDPLDENSRDGLWSGILHALSAEISQDRWQGALKSREKEAEHIVERGGEPLRELAKAFDPLRKYRNDLFHAGWKRDRASAEVIMNAVEEHHRKLSAGWRRYVEKRMGLTRRAFIILSHELTEAQRSELLSRWNVREVISMPQDLGDRWRNLPPDRDDIGPELEPVAAWLRSESFPGDIAVIQGEHGATLLLALEARELGLVPVYATTKRVTEEHLLPDGGIQQERIFRHVRFRRFFR